MRFLLVTFAFIPLLLCSCPEEEEERERERRADEENQACRSCPMISKLADENCPIGFECNVDWQLTGNVLSAQECGSATCSELKCADRNATLAVDGRKVGKVRCKGHEWTLPTDPSFTTTSAVCAKSCGKRVCAWSHPKPSRDLYSPIDAKDPSQEEPCASADCPKGISVFTDEGDLIETLSPTPLVCSSNGKWKFGDAEERNVMCRDKCLCDVVYGVLSDGSEGACPPDTLCVPPTSGDECAQMCPARSSPMYVDAQDKPQSSPDIKCVGEDWVAAGSKDVTCAYKEGAGQFATPTGACKPLAVLTCPTSPGDCDETQLVYTPYKSGYRVMCKEGLIISTETPTLLLFVDCLAGTWKFDGTPITQVNCFIKEWPLMDCLGAVQSGAATVQASCKLGACTITCVDPTKQFQYDLPGGDKGIMSKILKCLNGELKSPSMQGIVNAKCV